MIFVIGYNKKSQESNVLLNNWCYIKLKLNPAVFSSNEKAAGLKSLFVKSILNYDQTKKPAVRIRTAGARKISKIISVIKQLKEHR